VPANTSQCHTLAPLRMTVHRPRGRKEEERLSKKGCSMGEKAELVSRPLILKF
jgi:hypothetical protein